MKQLFLLVCLLLAGLAFSGCVQQPGQITSYKYVCPGGTIVDKVALCPANDCIGCEAFCEDYCNQQEEPAQAYTVEYVKSEMDKASYCATKDDCALPDTKCPLGCYNLVNKSELERINALVKSFKQTCYQTCTTLDENACDANKCKPVLFGEG